MNFVLHNTFATHAVQVEKIPIDIVGAWLKQKSLEVTDYYSKPTESLIAKEADFFLARLAAHVNVGWVYRVETQPTLIDFIISNHPNLI